MKNISFTDRHRRIRTLSPTVMAIEAFSRVCPMPLYDESKPCWIDPRGLDPLGLMTWGYCASMPPPSHGTAETYEEFRAALPPFGTPELLTCLAAFRESICSVFTASRQDGDGMKETSPSAEPVSTSGGTEC